MQSDNLGRQVERFLLTKHNQQTQTWYSKYLRPMAAFLGAERSLKSVAREDAEAYWQHLRNRRDCWQDNRFKPTVKRALSPTSLDNALRAIRTFWNELVRQRLMGFNPFDHLRAPKDRRPVQMKAILPDDLRAIREAAIASGPRDFAIVTMLATTGVRAGELVSMKLHQLDFKCNTAWVNGKRGWRKVFLGETCVEAIQAYLRERPQTNTDALWLNNKRQPLTADGVRFIVDGLATAAGVQGRHNLHAFRHRAAQSWLDSGVNAEIVSQALGHADVNVTLFIYGNQDEKRVQAAMRQMELVPFADPDDSPE